MPVDDPVIRPVRNVVVRPIKGHYDRSCYVRWISTGLLAVRLRDNWAGRDGSCLIRHLMEGMSLSCLLLLGVQTLIVLTHGAGGTNRGSPRNLVPGKFFLELHHFADDEQRGWFGLFPFHDLR